MLDSFKHFVGKKTKEPSQIEAYKSLLEKNPKNIDIRLKLGDLYSKMGDKQAAINEYTMVAVQYAEDGYLVKAIAVNKIIVRLDPARQEALERLSDLYFQRGVSADPLVQSYREARQQQEKQAAGEQMAENLAALPLVELDEAELALAEDTRIRRADSYLKENPLLVNLSEETHRWLKRHVTVRHFPEDEVILRSGEKQTTLFIVADGNVKMLTKDREGQDTVLDILSPGAFFGEIALFKPIRQTPDNAPVEDLNVITETACTLIEITNEDLAALAKREPDFSEMLLTEYYKRRASEVTLARVPLFSYLEPMERRKIAERLTSLNVKKGTVIITEGEAGDCMYLIKAGEVGIYTTLVEEDGGASILKSNNDRLQLATLKDGDFFGEQALITKEPRSATVIALTDVQLLKFSIRDLAAVVKEYPRVGTLLKKYHQQRIAETMESLKSIW